SDRPPPARRAAAPPRAARPGARRSVRAAGRSRNRPNAWLNYTDCARYRQRRHSCYAGHTRDKSREARMADRLTRRDLGRTAAGAAALAVGLPRIAAAAVPENRVLRFIAQSDLRVLDPIWTTAYITRNHGYMVFDTLFAIDAEFAPHPQMVGDYSISPDKLTYQFKLRDGLGFHDGSPVRGVDCVASVKRWMARDGHGQS